ncbi:MAG: methionine--tRNA ligase [Gammaproteobacteria bacterium]|nr:methionine--tRNA ligase [Gammaproteobacteria bacterium]MDH5240361.1 methionine--tRNA ligase [Gammaproteobacteria bacterium]MDH5260587.1 methionine--tRNA ligase [Gammaproteobacteria bacterium]MDH5583077.1 methionine--tRNA ligase [Gammaproteobacteria bacterium]
MSAKQRTMLVTSALPYVNGPMHMGHLVEYLQSDIWVRFQKLRGHKCTYVCASDSHGTPIMLKARELGITAEQLTGEISAQFVRDFLDFSIHFDNYHTTHSVENEELVTGIYNRLRDAGDIYTKTIEQSYDVKEGMFLPDRFVRGTCPRCKSEDQPGDACEVCGTTNTPESLINPLSVLSGTTPVKRESEHYFFRLSAYEERLRQWMSAATLDKHVIAKLDEWFEAGLQDWDISRDAPYFGFRIPDTDDKYFYVWLDAPVGYLASFKHLCDRRDDLNFDEYWKADSNAEVYHFIGKDIMYFHTLFWPAVLQGAGFRTPTSVYAHGFLTVNGQKMSKSRGTFIKARTYLDNLNPEFLRYYYAAKLGHTIEDIDLNLEDFVARVNSDLVGKLINIASRCAGFITKQFDGQLAASLPDPALFAEFTDASEIIADHYERREFSKAMRLVMSLADKANRYIDDQKPWIMAKNADSAGDVQAVCTQGLNMFRTLMIYLAPVLPVVAEGARAFLNEKVWQWQDASQPLLSAGVEPFKPLLTRVEPEQVQRLIAQSEESTPVAATESEDDIISIDDFMKIDLRIARIETAEAVEGADKLLALTLDVGDSSRKVFAGIKAAYDPDSLVGRHVIVVANLAPRRMKFGVSEGMVLAAGPGGSDIFLLSADQGAKPGMRVK